MLLLLFFVVDNFHSYIDSPERFESLKEMNNMMLIKWDVLFHNTKCSDAFSFHFVLVLNGKNIENQLGIHIVDSGIGNPRQVREN